MNLTALPWPAELAVRFAASTLVPVLVVGLSVAVASAATALPDDAAFRVGDHIVTTQQFDKRVHTLGALYGVVPPTDNGKLDEFRRASAQTLALSMVLENAAAQRDIVVAEKTARDVLTKQIEQGFQKSGRDGFADFLGKVGASEQDVIEAIRLQQSVGLLFQSVVSVSPEQVTDEDVRRYYEQHKNELAQPETRRIRNIVVATEGDGRDVSERARTGADFAALVQQYSLDESTRASGGDLGFVARTQLDGPYGDAAFAAQPGTVFGPVETGSGWNVSEVVEIRPSGPPHFEQIEDQLRAGMARKRALDKWNAWVDQQVRSADIQYADEYRPSGQPVPTGHAPGSPPTDPAGHPQ